MWPRCLLSLTIAAMFGGCVCPNPAAWFVSPIDPNSALCTGGVSGDMGPAGSGPYIDWATPRVPIGAPTVEIQGGRFDPAGLTVEIDSGSTKIQTQIVSNVGGTLIVKPAWPTPAPAAGNANIVATNSSGTSSPKAITLVQLGFKSAGTATPSLSQPKWMYFGKLQAQPQLFFFAQQTLYYMSYVDATGTFGSMPAIGPGMMALAVTTDLDGDNTTDFAAIDTARELLACRYSVSYSCSGAVGFGVPQTADFAALAAGQYDSTHSLIAAASQDQKLYRCFFDRQMLKGQLCVPIASFTDTASTVLVQALSPSGRADIIVLNQVGQVSIWRSDTSDAFTKCPDCMDATVAGRNFVAMAITDMDGKNGTDLVAVDSQGVVVLLNDGQGKLKAIPTSVTPMPMASAITLGDVDNDAKPDLVLTEANTGRVWLWLNQSDGQSGDGKLGGPVPASDASLMKQITIGSSGLVTQDRQDGDHNRRLITMDPTAGELRSWDNVVQP